MIYQVIFVIMVSLGLLLGLFVTRKPARVIEIQRRFYAFINWRIEPISMQKEIRNTRAMGSILIIFVVSAIIYVVCLQ